jgi:hypothetical protein
MNNNTFGAVLSTAYEADDHFWFNNNFGLLRLR